MYFNQQNMLFYLYIAVLVLLACLNIHKLRLLFKFFRYRKKPILPAGTFAELPQVTIQLPVYNEKYVIKRLITSVCKLDYPKDKLEVQVLDDSTDATSAIAQRLVRHLAAHGHNIKYIHRENREGYKAGALQHGLKYTSSQLLAIFDADFVPPRDFLMRTVNYFTDPKVGLVQARWGFINANYSLLTKIQSIFLNGHFIVEHLAKNRSGSFFNFNGTAGIWRRQTIESSGGWQGDTITEDLDLSYRAQINGWQFVYLPDLVVPSELPINIHMLKNQQFRWTKGMTQCALKLVPRILRSHITPVQKIDACLHLVSNSGYVNTMLLAVLIIPTLIIFKSVFDSWSFLIIVTFFCVNFLSIWFYYVVVQSAAEGYKTEHLKNVLLMILIGIALSINSSIAIFEAILGRQSEFVRTPKFAVDRRGRSQETQKKTGYRIPLNKAIIFEILFFFYFIFNLYLILRYHHYHLIPILLLFMASFVYVIFQFYESNLGGKPDDEDQPEDVKIA
jgi:cellulose synthase/poly-beta-1,6-N-acetylglucosamine synthase-like glycosyltransferase